MKNTIIFLINFIILSPLLGVNGVMSGFGTKSAPYLIEDYTDLKAIGTGSYSNSRSYRLVADIDASASENENEGNGFIPIGTPDSPFTGDFFGGGYEIKNLFINNTNSSVGLLGYVEIATIDSLHLSNVNITGNNSTGGVAGYAYNCLVREVSVIGKVSGGNSVGGVIGLYRSVNPVTNCKFDGEIAGEVNIGGIIGSTNGDVLYSYFNGEISGNTNIGGITGNIINPDFMIRNCKATGNLAGNNRIGGISGTNSGRIKNCKSSCTINGVYETGGISGRNYSVIDSCNSTGDIYGSYKIGGIAGEVANINGCYITNSSSSGIIFGDSSFIGGIVGYNNEGRIYDCYSTANISGNNYTGGIVGISENGHVYNSYTSGNITGNNFVGGIAGRNSFSQIKTSYSTGKIEGNNKIGGLTGENTGWISNCYVTGKITGGYVVGGLVGNNTRDVYYSYSIAEITGDSVTGGLVGSNSGYNNNAILGLYWNKKYSNQDVAFDTNTSAGIVNIYNLLDFELQQANSYDSLNFISVWSIRNDTTFPVLRELNNAPFAFSDTLISSANFNLIGLLHNDFDFENSHDSLVVTIDKLSDGFFKSGRIYFPNDAINGDTLDFSYRVGELLPTFNDTLWGSITNSYLILNNLNEPVIQINNINTDEDVPIKIAVSDLASDMDGDAIIVLSFDSPENGIIEFEQDSLIYIPSLNYYGLDSFKIQVSDGISVDSGSISVTINSINDAPILNKYIETNEDIPFKAPISNIVNDVEGEAINILGIEPPSKGIAYYEQDSLIYIPSLNYNGLDSFKIKVSDGVMVDSGLILVTINSINDAPILNFSIPDITIYNDTVIDISSVFIDIDNDILSLNSQSANESILSTTIIDNELEINFTNDIKGEANIYLSAVDDSGAFAFDTLTVIGIEANSETSIFEYENSITKLYPNPFYDELNIKLSHINKGFIKLNLIDLNGRTISSSYFNILTSGTASLQIETDNIDPGIYFLEIILNNKEIISKQLIKQTD